MANLRRQTVTMIGYGLALLASAWVAVVTLLYFSQEKLIFPGSRLEPGYRFSFGYRRFEEIRAHVPGATLHALHFMQPAPRGLVFFLHGNGGDVSSWATGLDFYERVGYDLFLFDYRGYGLSTGTIESEAQLHADVRVMWDTIAPGYAVRKLPVVIYGRSLGAALAVPLARDVNPALVVLATPFTSLASMAARLYPIVPSWLVRYPLRTEDIIGEVRSPVVLIHGTRDELIPLSDSEALLRRIRSRGELIRIEGAAHNDLQDFPAYLDALAARIGQVAAP